MLDIIGLQDFPVSIFNTQTAVNSSVIIKKDKNTNDYIKKKEQKKILSLFTEVTLISVLGLCSLVRLT